ncbi:MAG: RIP metalloprotease RseP [Verrucomicrobiota bacterium]|nr:RIP metalloprotease RseP [Verrucomicrobiota bacterium]
MEFLNFLFILLEVIVLFNILIIVHELGHFLAAKWRGLVVERFGIWFGKSLWEREFRGVKYSLGSIPAGGFVALPQMAPMEAIEGKGESPSKKLPPIGVLDKIIVAFAGPLFSFGLAYLFAVLIWGVGKPVSERDTTTTVGYVFPDSPAEKAGLLAGDILLKVNNAEVTRWSGIGDAVTWQIVSSTGDSVPLSIDRGGKQLTLEAYPEKQDAEWYKRGNLRQIQVAPFQSPIVAGVEQNSPAAQAGIQPNDIIRKVNDEAIFHPRALSQAMDAQPGKAINVTVERDGAMIVFDILPVIPSYIGDAPPAEEQRPMLGIKWDLNGNMEISHPSPNAQIKASVMAMVNTFKALFTEGSDIGAQHLSGPVGIMRIYYMLFQSDYGWRLALWFSVILNVNLAILNLLPIPVLDGGHIVMACIEGIIRRPIPFFILNYVQTGFALLVICYMAYVSFFDVQDLGGQSNETSYTIKFEPTPSGTAE